VLTCLLVVGATYTQKPRQAAPDEGKASLVAPGRGKHHFRSWSIDARSCPTGGTLHVFIQTGSGCECSFDLWPATAALPKKDFPHSLASKYNVGPNSKTELTYHFRLGQQFVFTGEGSWNVPAGETNTCKLKVSVESN